MALAFHAAAVFQGSGVRMARYCALKSPRAFFASGLRLVLQHPAAIAFTVCFLSEVITNSANSSSGQDLIHSSGHSFSTRLPVSDFMW